MVEKFKGRGNDWRSALESYKSMSQKGRDIMAVNGWLLRKFINGCRATNV